MKTLLLILGYLTCCHSAAVSISVDPCVNHKVLDQPWRSVKCLNQKCSADLQCDNGLVAGWSRFNSPGGSIIPETVVAINHCSTNAPGWLNGSHPTPGDGEVTRRVCFHWSGNPCHWTQEIKIKRCSDYFVYYLSTAPTCNLAYCTAEAVVPTLPPTPQTTRAHIASSMTVPNATSSSSGVNGKEFKLVIKLMGDFDLASIQKIILELKLSLRNRFPDLDLHLSVGDD
ncbi:uromodulin-like [Scyliorhinus torazame]|uniref:uromodulin-like n=1 Tax=Scyliorhinus torazame TaxID=75743 RepID=UPI003B5B9F41